MAVDVVWLKRDLRLRDHAPLAEAIAQGRPLILLYVHEPTIWALPDHAPRHRRFVEECLADMQQQLVPHGRSLLVCEAEMAQVLPVLHQRWGIHTLHSHRETGLAATYARDRRVAAWCHVHGVHWSEHDRDGVQRGRRDRQGWMEQWHHTMQAPKAHVDRALLAARMVQPEQLDHPFPPQDPLPPEEAFQAGGEHAGQQWLRSWVEGRISRYAASISKPAASRTGCSRLSPYLAWGCLSARQVYQAQEHAVLRSTEGRNFRAFADRLRWRDHFIQKFEMEDRMEHEHLHPAFEAYPWSAEEEPLRRWETGTTGYPMVDACMRSLIATGYLNFRMRAMLVSFATQVLGVHWKRPALHLAQQFLDYEPGIHYPQVQMQAGTTAIHTLRLYDPVKQGLDHDPEGNFIRTWVPELRALRGPLVHTPWALTPLERMAYRLDYPEPVVPYPTALSEARDRVYAFRKGLAFDHAARRIVQRHTIPGSRRT